MKERVSLVNYLNAVPLGWGFTHGPYKDEFEILHSSPACCADQLRSGEADIGLIPSIEYQQIPDLNIIPDIAIGSKKKVKSVILISKVPIEKIKRVSIDASSRTSVALLKILLLHFYDVEATFYPSAPKLTGMLTENDAALIIGDPALTCPPDMPYRVFDLASEWHKFTGKPFVFALWGVRSNVSASDKLALFQHSKELGMRNLETIAGLYSSSLRMKTQDIIKYLTECVCYDLEIEDIDGLQLFYHLAHEIGLIAEIKPLNFVNVAIPKTLHFLNSRGTPT